MEEQNNTAQQAEEYTLDDVMKAISKSSGEIQKQFDGVNKQFTGVNGRLEALEHKMGNVESTLVKVEEKLTKVETRLTGVETGLGKVADVLEQKNVITSVEHKQIYQPADPLMMTA